MAGFLQTGTLVDGQWMTRNVDINTVLERHNERQADEIQSEADKPPEFGLLTQTLIDCPVIRWILPARIRSFEYHDVAFIGDNYVQLRRLDHNGTLEDVTRKADFGSRIRNACIIGSTGTESRIQGDLVLPSKIQDRNGDVSMGDATGIDFIPPQFILLALESGDLLFLFAYNTNQGVEFITGRHKLSRAMALQQGGKHLTVDPSSRYMATAGSENVFAVYALKSKEDLATNCVKGEPFRPIASEQYLHVRGVIHKIEFLFPSVDDPDHIILVLLVAKGGSTAMFVYEWIAGQSLTEIRSNNLKGHSLAPRYRMPLLFIPLRIKSVFLLVGANCIVECHNVLEGSPDARPLYLANYETSQLHLGTNEPLWTAWTRPPRTQSYSKTHDDIYIAREDGLVVFLEIKLEPSTQIQLVQTMVVVGNFRTNIGTAFANLDLAFPGPDGGDFLVTGGDTGDGGSYLVAARESPKLVETIVNWSPTIDFVTTARPQSGAESNFVSLEASKKEKLVSDDPDRIFACTGRGQHGAVSEIRYGCEARIRLDVDGLDVPITETWVLPVTTPDPVSQGWEAPAPLLFLLSVGDQSMLLHLTADSKEIEEIPESLTWLDLQSRTLAAAACNGLIIQITERSVNISAEQAMMRSGHGLPAIYREEYPASKIIVAASVYRDKFALIVTRGDDGDLKLTCLRIRANEASENDDELPSIPSVEIFGRSVTLNQYPISISIVRHSNGSVYGIVGAAERSSSSNIDVDVPLMSNVLLLSAVFKLEPTSGLVKIDHLTDYWPLDHPSSYDALPEACVSIANLRGPEAESDGPELLLAGYRSGLLVMRCYRMTQVGALEELKVSQYQIGSTPVTFKVDPAIPNVALICCDAKLWTVRYDSQSNADPKLHRVWFTDTEQPLHLQPLVNYVSILPQGLLLSAGRRLLVSSLNAQPRPIPRKMPLDGSPHRILYSHRVGKLIIAMSVKGRSTITFLDPETGSMASNYHDSAGNKINFPLGLGVLGEKILSLVEWQWDLPTRTGFIIVGTSEGSLILYQIGASGLSLGNGELSLVPFLEAHYDSPVYAIVPCEKSFFYCVDQRVRWATVNGSQDKLLTRAEYKLPSRAISMSVDGHWLNILTVRHSLVTLLLVDRKKHAGLGENHGQLVPQFSDEVERDGLDQIPLISASDDQLKKESALIMVSDKDCAVAGLWYRKKEQLLGRSYQLVFEADLPSSIIKFRFCRTRPLWDKVWKSSGTTTPNCYVGELLGLGIDGSITHFTLLEAQLLHLLRFLHNLARRASDAIPPPHITESAWHDKDSRTRHIDGELLRPILAHRGLERLLMMDETGSENGTEGLLIGEFCSLVNELQHGDINTSQRPVDEPLERCLEEVYRILADVLRPIL